MSIQSIIVSILSKMSSATATTAATKKVTKVTKTTKTSKSTDGSSDAINVTVDAPAPAQDASATVDFGSDEEGPTVTIEATSEVTNDKPKKRGRKTNAEKAAAEATPSQEGSVSIGSVADALSRFSALESDLQVLVEFLRKNKTPFSKSEVTDLTRHHKKTNELHSKLSDSVVSTLSSTATVAVASATAAAAGAEKSKKGFKKDGQLRKKAEHKNVDIHQVLQKYMDDHNILDALKAKDPEFATAFEERDDKRLTRPEVQQVFSHIISEMKKAYPEETKSTMMRTKKEKDGSEITVTDNTYYTVHGADVTKFLKDTSDIIKAEIAKGDVSKYNDNITTLQNGSMIDADGNIPNLISQKWHMSYINFFITRD
jgi:hypothetical protein